MNKKFLALITILLCKLSISVAGFGINCSKPTISSAIAGTLTAFTFTCINNTPATFSSFNLAANQLTSPSAGINFPITWPHSSNNIKPQDVWAVNGTFLFPIPGDYSFYFTKNYGDEIYSGIFV